MDLSKYRVDGFHWVESFSQRIGADHFYEYLKKTYGFLDKLKKGHSYNIAAIDSDTKREIFIKCTCLYIYEHPGQSAGLMFNKEFTKITRIADKEV